MYIYETEIHEAITTNTVVISSHNKPIKANKWQLYMVVITHPEHGSFTKIGISYNSTRRFNKDLDLAGCHVLFTDVYSLPASSRKEAEKYEKYVQHAFMDFSIKPPFEFNGKTECYSVDMMSNRHKIKERIYERIQTFTSFGSAYPSIESIEHQSI